MEFLKEFRKKKGYTTMQMAQALQISNSLYTKVESDFRLPSQNFLTRFKQCFPDFDMNIFFGNSNHDSCSTEEVAQ